MTTTQPTSSTAPPALTMQTAGGRILDPLAPRPEDFDIDDIAHGLSHICRWGGHTPAFYSVAQHSVLVGLRTAQHARSDLFAPYRVPAKSIFALGLLHDASEAYLGDAIWPLKKSPAWGVYRAAEERLQRCILERFGLFLDDRIERIIKWADAEVLLAEARDFMGDPDWARARVAVEGMVPYPQGTLVPLAPAEAMAQFMFWAREAGL